MNVELILAAVKKAIEQGAVAAPPVQGLSEDENYVRAQVNVGIDPKVLACFVANLRTDPTMAEFDGLFANSPLGTGVRVGLSNVGQLLLAQAIATGDAESTVRRFADYVESNSAGATAVMAVAGIKTKQPIRLGPDVVLVPMESLPSSSQRAAALGKGSLAFLGPRFPMPSALTTDFTFQPVFYKPKNPQPREDSAYEVTLGAQSLLEEACHLLSLLGLNSAPQMFWVQPKDWLMAGGMAAAWSSYGPEFFGVEAEAPAQEIEALAGDYFSIEASKRSKVLRIPLDRLSRAGRERDLADRAIDLGIALESLLLHDTGSTSELRFRLSYRGAWLLGNDAETRLEVQQSLVKLYDLRSQAVHAGFIKEPPEAAATLKRAAEICRALIHRVIVLKCDVEWAKLVLGG